MSHPYTSDQAGFREFDGSSFGELVTTGWNFDGTESDVREFASENLCCNDPESEVESVKEVISGTFDVLMTDGSDYRVYTAGTEA